MKTAVYNAYGKINLALDITGKREDGYHLIESVMHSISIHDTVTLKENTSGEITVICNELSLPQGNKNIAYKAARAFYNYTGNPIAGLHIIIEKNIPSQAGLGGGSADAAAVLMGLNAFCHNLLSVEELKSIGQTIGCDVPFCLVGGAQLATGAGEILQQIPTLPLHCGIVVAKDMNIGVDTKVAYNRYDRCEGAYTHPNINGMLSAMSTGALSTIAQNVGNLFEQIVPLKQVETLKMQLTQLGALVAGMSGSGSAVFGIFQEYAQASAAASELKTRGIFAAAAQPTLCGVEKN